ncbi:MAG: ABC transporter ATP-binding protein [Spirochaetia bacterium]
MNGPFFDARGLTWAVGNATIVDRLELTVHRGELVGVIGPNGAGKTTLLRLLAGLLPPTAGEVRLDGREIGGMESRSRARLVSFMTQEVSQVFPFTVREILLMGRYPHLGRFQREGAEDVERARRMLSYVGLMAVEDRGFGGLSGGERQLVLFAKALVQDTDGLLLDEPSSSLDIHHQDRIFSMAQELAREGRAVIASVHNLSVAAQYCSRLVLLEKGRIASDGRPEQVLRSETLDRVYGVRTIVSPSLATGSLTVTVVPPDKGAAGYRVHLIGGAGSAVNLTRELYRLGCSLTGGIAHEYDSDEKLWRSLGIRCMSVGAFSRITDEQVKEAAPLVAQADLTILCSFPIGQGNLGNLRLASMARRLLVLKPGPEELPRTFFSAEGRTLFEQVCAGSRVLDREGILEELVRARDNSTAP